MTDQTYWVYILHCENDTYYTGYTNDLVKRFESHVNGTASKYTRSFKPLKIAQYWKINNNQSFAMQVEHYIKKLSRIEKKKIIENPSTLLIDYSTHTVNIIK